MLRYFGCALLLLISISGFTQLVQPYGPVPTRQQVQWQEMEFYLFIHFGPNTFTDLEWGKGSEDEKIFNPTQLDCRQWARIAKEAGAKGIILTAKHHDGFCLWPSKYSKHTVRESSWKDGKGDVVRELSQACDDYGIKFGIYISPWDRNHPKYGTPQYNRVYIRTMKELLNNYGPLFELWWDGANGEGPNGKKQVYDFHRFERAARKWAPNTVIFSDIGPDVRWVGNEKGIAGETNWSLLDTAGFTRGIGAPSQDTLNHGNINGKNWIPAECDVSIRPGWFYHQNEDSLVKTPKQLMDLFLVSVGRNANLLLNVPPDRRGLINEHDSAALMEFKKLRDSYFANNVALRSQVEVSADRPGYLPQVLTDGNRSSYWAAPEGSDSCSVVITLDSEKAFNTIVLQEYIEMGQRVKSFTVEAWNGTAFSEIAKGTTIGNKRIISFPNQQSSKIRLTINDSKAEPVLSEIQLYNAPL